MAPRGREGLDHALVRPAHEPDAALGVGQRGVVGVERGHAVRLGELPVHEAAEPVALEQRVLGRGVVVPQHRPLDLEPVAPCGGERGAGARAEPRRLERQRHRPAQLVGEVRLGRGLAEPREASGQGFLCRAPPERARALGRDRLGAEWAAVEHLLHARAAHPAEIARRHSGGARLLERRPLALHPLRADGHLHHEQRLRVASEHEHGACGRALEREQCELRRRLGRQRRRGGGQPAPLARQRGEQLVKVGPGALRRAPRQRRERRLGHLVAGRRTSTPARSGAAPGARTASPARSARRRTAPAPARAGPRPRARGSAPGRTGRPRARPSTPPRQAAGQPRAEGRRGGHRARHGVVARPHGRCTRARHPPREHAGRAVHGRHQLALEPAEGHAQPVVAGCRSRPRRRATRARPREGSRRRRGQAAASRRSGG